MVPRLRWQDPEGRATINSIIKKLVPKWTTGLRDVQIDLVSLILDGRDVLCCTATGDGKSAAFSVPCLVLHEYNRHPELYPTGFPSRSSPVGIVITPTKGLDDNIVHELSKLNVPALSYCQETITEARKAAVNLGNDIMECTRWQVVCVDPEHLHDRTWRQITDSAIFRSNVLFVCVDEAHLVNEWGLSFRLAFGDIGTFVRGRFPSTISVAALTATLQPGPPTTAICKSLGFFEGRFTFIRRSNKRPNTQFVVQVLDHGLNGDSFPSLLPFLASGRKLVIHCPTLDMVFRGKRILTFPSSSQQFPALEPLCLASESPLPPLAKKTQLTKKEHAAATIALKLFGENVRLAKRFNNEHPHRPRCSYLPTPMVTKVLSKLLLLHCISDLETLLDNSWTHYNTHGSAFFDRIMELQAQINNKRKEKRDLLNANQREKRKAKKAALEQLRAIGDRNQLDTSTMQIDAEDQAGVPVMSSLRQKRAALEPINTTRKRPRAQQRSLVAEALDLRPAYRPRPRPVPSSTMAAAESSTNLVAPTRRSARLRS